MKFREFVTNPPQSTFSYSPPVHHYNGTVLVETQFIDGNGIGVPVTVKLHVLANKEEKNWEITHITPTAVKLPSNRTVAFENFINAIPSRGNESLLTCDVNQESWRVLVSTQLKKREAL